MAHISAAAPRRRNWVAMARRELLLVLALLACALVTLAFLGLADAVVDGHTARFDVGIIRMLRRPGEPGVPIGPKWLEAAIIDFTALGSVTVLTVVVLIVAGVFLAIRRWRQALMLVVASLSGLVLVHIAKTVVDRSRPPLDWRLLPVTEASFPSGHAALSAIVYLTLATLAARFSPSRRLSGYVLAVGLILTIAVGASRVYLGVHWATDVVAGWAMGAAWASLMWAIAWRAERRHVEHPPLLRLDKERAE